MSEIVRVAVHRICDMCDKESISMICNEEDLKNISEYILNNIGTRCPECIKNQESDRQTGNED